MQNIEIERGNPLQLTFICPCSSQQSSAFSAWTGRIKCLDWCAKSPCDKRDLNLIVWTFTPYSLPQSIWGSWPSLQPLAGPCREGSSSIWSSWFPPSIAPACKKPIYIPSGEHSKCFLTLKCCSCVPLVRKDWILSEVSTFTWKSSSV